MTKKCKTCFLEKAEEEFPINWKYRKNSCKECLREYSKAHYSENIEKISNDHKEYYNWNKEKVLANQKEWYSNNRDKKLERCKQYKSTTKWKLTSKVSSQKRRVIMKWFWNDWTVTQDNINNKLISQDYKCGYCECDLKIATKHLDHIHPLSKWGTHSIDNVHWTCDKCNLTKWAKSHEEFLTIINNERNISSRKATDGRGIKITSI